ncbi:hypothetical protein HDU76_011111 [Blyttiomyces sp. JEL0837]|nr:hypothetical protein HDU76_011111 [Blyttiomyces sp. JEL0837]
MTDNDHDNIDIVTVTGGPSSTHQGTPTHNLGAKGGPSCGPKKKFQMSYRRTSDDFRQQAQITPQQSHRSSLAAGSFVTSSPYSPLPPNYYEQHRSKDIVPPPSVDDGTSDEAEKFEDGYEKPETLKRKRESYDEDADADSNEGHDEDEMTEDEDDKCRQPTKRLRTKSPLKPGAADDEDYYFDEEVEDDYFEEEEEEGSVEGDDEGVVEEVEEGGEEGKVALTEPPGFLNKIDGAFVRAGDNFFEELEREAVSGGVEMDMDMKDVVEKNGDGGEKEKEACVERGNEKEAEGLDSNNENKFEGESKVVKEVEKTELEKEVAGLADAEESGEKKELECEKAGEQMEVVKEGDGLEDAKENGVNGELEGVKTGDKIGLEKKSDEMEGYEKTKVEDSMDLEKIGERVELDKEKERSEVQVAKEEDRLESDKENNAKVNTELVNKGENNEFEKRVEGNKEYEMEMVKQKAHCYDLQLKAVQNIARMALDKIEAFKFKE